ncbi:16S rRNA (uracil(1498)-N(3))-methyltransferase [Candidatus Peregrinibacteria bacterium]|nr:16S rRNA (uracil(1498)-N(3))-methyltransferase [Candidatus Peregrinibacteria bacterium]
MQYFFINRDLHGDSIKITDKDLIHQMKDVLRFRTGEKIMLLDNKGNKAAGTVKNINKEFTEIELSEHSTCKKPLKTVRLFMALSKKPATFELIIQKATELGVAEIIPLITSRCQVQNLRNIERHLAIIKEAAEQSERCFLPELKASMGFSELISDPPKGIILAGDARMYDKKLKEIDLKTSPEINLIIGPEGGLTDDELNEIKRINGKIFLLGENILRMETAAIAALAIII